MSWFKKLESARKQKQESGAIKEWRQTGSVPPPHILKQHTVREYARRFGLRTLVETGTYMGEMVAAMSADFDQIHSIELGADLFEKARQRFTGMKHVHLHHGDSATTLPEVLRQLDGPTLFWLDGHYSAGITAKGSKDTPIVEELEAIYRHDPQRHVILIDDARLFDGSADYPAMDDLRQRVTKWSPNTVMEVADDIIRLHRAQRA